MRRAGAVLTSLGLLLAACSKADRPLVDRLEIDRFEGGEVISMREPALRERLVAALKAARFEVLAADAKAPADAAPWRVRLAAGLEEPEASEELPPGHPGSLVQVVLDWRQRGSSDGFEVKADVFAPQVGNDVEAIEDGVRTALERALASAAAETRGIIELSRAKDDAVVAALTDPVEARRAAAVRVLVMRKNHAAVPALLERLKQPHLSELHAAVGLLVELKAQEAVNAMIDASRQRGPVVEREILYAVAAIGGDDAEAYLDLVASGSDDPAVRDVAARALAELRAARAPKPPGEHQ